MTDVIEETWVSIEEFPEYSVSDLGRVKNMHTGREVHPIPNNHGNYRVAFRSERYTRSVALLVAEAFVEPIDDRSDCVVILDGNLGNVAALNLVWRPRHFAIKYAHQMRTPQPLHFQNLRVLNEDLRIVYDSIIECGTTEGVLFEDIWESTYMGRRPYPFNHRYRILYDD